MSRLAGKQPLSAFSNSTVGKGNQASWGRKSGGGGGGMQGSLITTRLRTNNHAQENCAAYFLHVLIRVVPGDRAHVQDERGCRCSLDLL